MDENATTTTTPERRERRRRPVAAAILATLALGGIGAAITSAAWTDNVFFAAPAQAAEFNLQGSLDGATWVESDNPEAIELNIDSGALANLLPNQTRTITLYVKNTGTVNASLVHTEAFAAGTTFTDAPKIAVTDLAENLAPNDSDAFTLTVTTPENWDAANQGATGTIVVTVEGTAVAG